MKKIISSFLLMSTLMGGAQAFEKNDRELGMFVTSAPLHSASHVGTCVTQGLSDLHAEPSDSCGISVRLSPMSSSTLLTLAMLKEDVQAVRQDAYDTLAGLEMTLALEEAIQKIRQEAPELNHLSNTEIIQLILELN
jgi:hypothetical protein